MRQAAIKFALSLLALVALWPAAAAVQTGEVRLQGMPAYAFTYVDGQVTTPADGRLQLAAGCHQLQVEAPSGNGFAAFSQEVEVRANQSSPINVTLLPVYVAYPYGSGPLPAFAGPMSPGPPGYSGPRGLDGRAAAGLILNPQTTQTAALLTESVGLLLDDLEAQVRRLRNRSYVDRPQAYWYNPKHLSEASGGPVGPAGPPGAMGLPGDSLLLRDNDGRVLLKVIQDQLKLPLIENRLVSLSLMNSDFAENTPAKGDPHLTHCWLPPIAVRTPAFKRRLDVVYEALQRRLVTEPLEGPLGPSGAVGAAGVRGADGSTGEFKPYILSKEHALAVKNRVYADKKLRARVDQIERDADELNRLLMSIPKSCMGG